MNKEPFHILLADDDEGDTLLFKLAFSELKITTLVRTVNNGIQLMEWLTVNDNPLPDVLFLDLNMPRKSGLQCLKEIRSNEKLKELIVAIYSTSDNEKDVDETFSQGANVYITKPTDFKMLKQVLEKAVGMAYKYQDPRMNRRNFLLKI